MDMAYLTITQNDLKQLKDWKVGEKYSLQLEVELTGLNKQDGFRLNTMEAGSDSSDIITGSFEIESVSERTKDGKKASYKKMYAAAREGKIAE